MRNKPTTEKAIAFMAKNPTYLGTVHGVDLYEHPTLGDETVVYGLTKEGKIKKTSHWEVPTAADGEDLKSL